MKLKVQDYIKVFDGFFTKKQCKLIINSLDTFKNKTHSFYNLKNNDKKTVGNDPEVSFLRDEKIITTGDLIKDKWFKIIEQYILVFLKKEKMDWYNGWNGFSFPKFMQYTKGTSMKNHCDHIHDLFKNDGQSGGIPTLSIITALNDNYEGGELIMCEKFKYKLKTGETIIFPSNFLYPHEIKKLTKGNRYSMVSWVY